MSVFHICNQGKERKNRTVVNDIKQYDTCVLLIMGVHSCYKLAKKSEIVECFFMENLLSYISLSLWVGVCFLLFCFFYTVLDFIHCTKIKCLLTVSETCISCF